METKLWQVSLENLDQNTIKEAAMLLQKGELVAFPTETVYGLGANALDGVAIEKIYQAKGRPGDNPLIIHVASLKQVEALVKYISPTASHLMRSFWPGPLTLVMPKSHIVPGQITAGLDTVAIRMPAHPVALKLIEEANLPIAAPSANTSGKPSPTNAQHVWQDLQGKIAGIIDAGDTGLGLESTVLDMTTSVPTILRPGGITIEELRKEIGEINIDPHLANESLAPKSPGMKYTHYAPEAQVIIVNGSVEQIKNKFLHIMKKNQELKVGLMISQELYEDLKEEIPKGFYPKILGSRSELPIIGSRLFSTLRSFNQLEEVKIIYAEAFPKTDIGVAIMNRLYKAAGGKII